MKHDKNKTDGYGDIISLCISFFGRKKIEDPVLLDLREVNSSLSFFVIATCGSRIHCRATGRDLVDYLVKNGKRPASHPNYDSEWIVLDYGFFIIHLFTREKREFYQLEKIWADSKISKLNTEENSAAVN